MLKVRMTSDQVLLGLLRYIVFLFSTTCHEAAHAYVALKGGDPTAAEGGQVSLNPLPHIRREPFGMVVLPLLSLTMSGAMVGWASAPYNPAWQRAYPKRAALMALAGPMMNFALAILSGLLLRALLLSGGVQREGATGAVAVILQIGFQLNLLLGIFNLLPFPPFDGFGVLGLLTGSFAALESLRLRLRQFSIIGLVVGWQVVNYVFPPVYLFASDLIFGR
jgi:Zn-dependent protease